MIVFTSTCSNVAAARSGPIHHGVPSVRRDVIHTISQSNKRRGQDVKFLHNVLAHYGKDRIMLIGEHLYIYHGPHYTPTYPADSND